MEEGYADDDLEEFDPVDDVNASQQKEAVNVLEGVI